MISRDSLGQHWPIHPLGHLCEFLDHQRQPVTESDRVSGPYPYYGANGQQGTIDQYIFDEPLVLLAEDGGHFGNPDKSIAYRIRGKTWVNNHAHVLRPKNRLDIDYLCWVLERYDVTPFVTGTTRGKLTKSGASAIPIPLPPMEEQRRIAAILDKVEALRTKRRQALIKLDTLTQSLFLEMFGDPATNPKGWPIGTIEDLVSSPKIDIRCGPFGTQLKVAEIVDSGVPLFGIETAVGNEFNPNVRKFVTQNKAKQLKAFEALPGDVLITRMGTIGRACVVPDGFQEGRFSYHLFRVRPDRGKCIPDFLAATISRSGIFMRQLEDSAHGAIMDGLSTQNLKMVKFPIPPTNLQDEFVRRIGIIDQMKSRMDKIYLNTLFSSLQHHAFRGEL